MRDLTHDGFIERWAEFVKNNPKWKEHQTNFINSQYDKLYRFLKELSKTKEGQKKIAEIYGIKNVKGYSKLLKDL